MCSVAREDIFNNSIVIHKFGQHVRRGSRRPLLRCRILIGYRRRRRSSSVDAREEADRGKTGGVVMAVALIVEHGRRL